MDSSAWRFERDDLATFRFENRKTTGLPREPKAAFEIEAGCVEVRFLDASLVSRYLVVAGSIR